MGILITLLRFGKSMKQQIINKEIIEIIKVVHDDESAPNPLRIIFNLRDENNENSAFEVGITQDGETIFYNYYPYRTSKEKIETELYYGDVIIVDNQDDLHKLVGQSILNVYFGNGIAELIDNAVEIKKRVMYYFKIEVTSDQFLFFNNADEGCYCFAETIESVLSRDIYGFKWETHPPRLII